MTTIKSSAAQRRSILAFAHAKYYANPVEGFAAIEAAIGEPITCIQQEGTTTLLISLAAGEAIELDAYGNTLRGTV